MIGSIRRKCTDHIVPLGERHLLAALLEYQRYYNESRTHYSLDGNSPLRAVLSARTRSSRRPCLVGCIIATRGLRRARDQAALVRARAPSITSARAALLC